MMKPRRRHLLASAAGLLGASSPSPSWLHAAPRETLNIAAFPLVDKIVEAAAPHWARLHPHVALKVTSRQYQDHHTAMTTALSTAVALPDVMALEVSFVGRFAQGGGLEDLAQPPYLAAQHREQLVPYAYDQAVNRHGAVVAMPTDIGPGTMLHRVDLLARAKVEEAQLTATWDSYLEAGLKIKAATGAYLVGHVQQLKDIVVRSGVKSGDSLYYDTASRPLVTEPRFVRAFELARRVRRHKLDARVNAWSNEWAEGLRRGTLATELSGAWLVGQLNQWVAPQTRGLWRATQFPDGVFAPYGGAFYAMPRRAQPRRKPLAWDFIRLMTLSRELQFAAFKAFDAFPALLATHEDPFFDEPLSFLGGQRARLLWRDAARRIQATPVHKQNNFADEVVGTELDNVLERGKDIASALGDAHRLLERRAHR